eukprot:gene7798-10903_t
MSGDGDTSAAAPAATNAERCDMSSIADSQHVDGMNDAASELSRRGSHYSGTGSQGLTPSAGVSAADASERWAPSRGTPHRALSRADGM